MVSVLLIDDDTELSKLLEEYLQSEQFELHSAHDGPSGLEKALANHYSAVILDVMLPGMSGLDVLKQLRQKSAVPVLMLTARGSELTAFWGWNWVRTTICPSLSIPANWSPVCARSCAAPPLEPRLQPRSQCIWPGLICTQIRAASPATANL